MDDIEAPDAEGQLSWLVDRVQGGEEIVITREGRAIGRLLPPIAAFDRE